MLVTVACHLPSGSLVTAQRSSWPEPFSQPRPGHPGRCRRSFRSSKGQGTVCILPPLDPKGPCSSAQAGRRQSCLPAAPQPPSLRVPTCPSGCRADGLGPGCTLAVWGRQAPTAHASLLAPAARSRVSGVRVSFTRVAAILSRWRCSALQGLRLSLRELTLSRLQDPG